METNKLDYTPQDDIEVDTSGVQFPIEIEFDFRNAERAIPSRKEILLSPAVVFDSQKLVFQLGELDTVSSLYAALHNKVPGIQMNNHMFFFIDVTEPEGYTGFVNENSHVHLMAVKQAPTIVVFLNKTHFERAIIYRKRKLFAESFMEVLNEGPLSHHKQHVQYMKHVQNHWTRGHVL